MNDDFHVNNFFSNDPIEIDAPRKGSNQRKLDKLKKMITPEGLLDSIKITNPEMLEMIDSMASSMGISVDELLEKVVDLNIKRFENMPDDQLEKVFDDLENGRIPLQFDVQSIKNMLEGKNPDMQNFDFEEDYKTIFDEISKLFSGGSGGFQGLAESVDKMLNLIDNYTNQSNQQPTPDEPAPKNPLNKLQTLLSEDNFAGVLCTKDCHIYEKFLKFKEENCEDNILKISDFDENIQVFGSENAWNKITKIQELEYILNTDKYILLGAVPNNEEDVGFYIALILDENGNWALVAPEFGNTYNPDDDKELYRKEDYANGNDDDLLSSDALEKVKAGLDILLVEKKKTILTPLNFGTIIPQRVSFRNSSDMLKVGLIQSNESPEAILMKKDSDLDVDQQSFDFYFKFQYTLPEDILGILSSWLSKFNLNNCLLLDNLELRGKNGMLYVDIEDYDTFLKNIFKWTIENNDKNYN